MPSQPDEAALLPRFPGAVRATNGCGDAFLAAIALGIKHNLPARDCAVRALAAAALLAAGQNAVPEAIDQAIQNGGLL